MAKLQGTHRDNFCNHSGH